MATSHHSCQQAQRLFGVNEKQLVCVWNKLEPVKISVWKFNSSGKTFLLRLLRTFVWPKKFRLDQHFTKSCACRTIKANPSRRLNCGVTGIAWKDRSQLSSSSAATSLLPPRNMNLYKTAHKYMDYLLQKWWSSLSEYIWFSQGHFFFFSRWTYTHFPAAE